MNIGLQWQEIWKLKILFFFLHWGVIPEITVIFVMFCLEIAWLKKSTQWLECHNPSVKSINFNYVKFVGCWNSAILELISIKRIFFYQMFSPLKWRFLLGLYSNYCMCDKAKKSLSVFQACFIKTNIRSISPDFCYDIYNFYDISAESFKWTITF